MIKLKKILNEQTAGAEAKKRGLKHVGWGKYADPSSGQVVAKSEKGRLVRLKKPEPVQPKQKKPKAQDTKEKPAKPSPKPETPSAEKSDIPKVPDYARRFISTRIDKLAAMAQKAREKGEDPPDFDLCKITIPGTNLYCDDNLNIPRSQMPQFKGKPRPGTKAAELPTTPDGEVDTEPLFRQMLNKHGVEVKNTTIPSDQLKATQKELVGAKVARMTKALEKYPELPGITAPIYVSNDGYVIDGHHRWAALSTLAIKQGKPVEMDVRVIDMPARQIIPLANRFAEKMGVATKKGKVQEYYLERLLEVGCLNCGRKLMSEGKLKWKRKKTAGGFTEYVAETPSGYTFSVSQGQRIERVPHPITGKYRDVPRKYWVASMQDEKGRTSPDFYDRRSSSMSSAKAAAEKYAQHKGLI